MKRPRPPRSDKPLRTKPSRKAVSQRAGFPPVGVADVIERDADGDLFVRLTKADENSPLVRLAPDRKEAAAGAPGLGDRLLVRFEMLESRKRPVSAVADDFEVRDVTAVDVAEDRSISMTMLYDAGHNLDERILAEQFSD